MAGIVVNGASLRAIRERSGWSLGKFAAAVETKHSHISNLEAGRRKASPELLVRMAKVLDVPLAALTTDYPPEKVA